MRVKIDTITISRDLGGEFEVVLDVRQTTPVSSVTRLEIICAGDSMLVINNVRAIELLASLLYGVTMYGVSASELNIPLLHKGRADVVKE